MSLRNANQIKSGTLYVVATPIGNLEDITLRALLTLQNCDVIVAEDTLRTSRLLKHYQIQKTLISLHRFNEVSRCKKVLTLLGSGKSIAMVSDAGTPLISDPGQLLINQCIEHNIPVIALPGASAVLHALVVSGISCTPFFFAGFLPSKLNQRFQKLTELTQMTHTVVFFESPQRVQQTLLMLQKLAPERKICVARELTKIHEEVIRGKVDLVAKLISEKPIRGEFTIVLEGNKTK